VILWFSLIKDGGSQPSWITKVLKFYWLLRSGGPRWITVLNVVKIRQPVADMSSFRFIKLAFVWIFKILNSLTVHNVDRPILRHHTKFCKDLSNRCSYVAVYQFFFKIVAVHHFGLWSGNLDHAREVLDGFYCCAKLEWNRFSVSIEKSSLKPFSCLELLWTYVA